MQPAVLTAAPHTGTVPPPNLTLPPLTSSGGRQRRILRVAGRLEAGQVVRLAAAHELLSTVGVRVRVAVNRALLQRRMKRSTFGPRYLTRARCKLPPAPRAALAPAAELALQLYARLPRRTALSQRPPGRGCKARGRRPHPSWWRRARARAVPPAQPQLQLLLAPPALLWASLGLA